MKRIPLALKEKILSAIKNDGLTSQQASYEYGVKLGYGRAEVTSTFSSVLFSSGRNIFFMYIIIQYINLCIEYSHLFTIVNLFI